MEVMPSCILSIMIRREHQHHATEIYNTPKAADVLQC
jgi:hypothetical protein